MNADADLVDTADFAAHYDSLLDGLLTREAEARERTRLAVQRCRLKQRTTLAHLRRTVAGLEAQVRELRLVHRTPQWLDALFLERQRVDTALAERDRLRRIIAVQSSRLSVLTRHLTEPVPAMTWPHHALPRDTEARSIVMHAIADADFARMPLMLVLANLDNNFVAHRRHTPRIGPDNSLSVETAVLAAFPGHTFAAVAHAVWDVVRGVAPVPWRGGSYEQLAQVDDDVAYVASRVNVAIGRLQRRNVVKRFVDGPAAWAIVTRNVQADVLVPLDATPCLNEVAWIAVQGHVCEASGSVCTLVKQVRVVRPPVPPLDPRCNVREAAAPVLQVLDGHMDGLLEAVYSRLGATLSSTVDVSVFQYE